MAKSKAGERKLPKVRYVIYEWPLVLDVHLKELSCWLVGETSPFGVVLTERDGSDSPNN